LKRSSSRVLAQQRLDRREIRRAAVQREQARGQIRARARRRRGRCFDGCRPGVGRGAWHGGFGALDRQREPVAASGNGRERILPQQLAQRRDLHLQVVLFHHQAGPDEREQLVLGDQPAGAVDEHGQQVERPRAERDRLPVGEQPPFLELQLEAVEAARRALRVHGGKTLQFRLLGGCPKCIPGPVAGVRAAACFSNV
jgi:hypothetical protein